MACIAHPRFGGKIIAGIIPSHQSRILMLAQQGQRPAAIASHLKLGIGGTDRVWTILEHHGVSIAGGRAQA